MVASSAAGPDLLTQTLAVSLGNTFLLITVSSLYASWVLFKPVVGVLFVALLASSIVRQRRNQINSLLDKTSSNPFPITTQISILMKSTYTKILSCASDPTAPLSTLCDHPFVSLSFISFVHLYLNHLYHPAFLIFKTILFTTLAIFLHLFDKNLLFSYRKVGLTDDTLSSLLTLSEVFTTSAFLSTFILTQGLVEGVGALKEIGEWAKRELEDDVGGQWDSILGLLNNQVKEANETYGNETWWGMLEPIAVGVINGTDDEIVPEAYLGWDGFWNITTTIKEHVMNLNLTSDDVQGYVSIGATSGKVVASTLVDFTGSMASLFSAISDSAVSAILFVSVLLLLLNSPTDPLTSVFTDLLPTSFPLHPSYIVTALTGVLLLPLKLAATHAVVTVMFITIVGGKYAFLSAAVSFLHAFFPIAPAWLIPLPWAVALAVEGSWLRGVFCFVSIKAALSICDEKVYQNQLGSVNPLFTSLSVLFGYRSFGRQGVLLGPLILCVVRLVYEGIRGAEETAEGKGRARTASEVFTSIRNVLTPRGSSMDGGSFDWSDAGGTEKKKLFADVRVIASLKRKGKRETPVRVAFALDDDWEGITRKVATVMGIEAKGVVGIEGEDGSRVVSGSGVRDGEVLRVEVS